MFSMVKAFRGSAKDFFAHNRNGHKVNKGNLLILLPLIIFIQLLILEVIQRESIFQTFIWLGDYFYVFLINYFLVALFCFFFIALLGSLRWGVISSTSILIIFTLTNMVKEQFLGYPLLPWDLLRVDQAINLLPKIAGEIVIALILIVLLNIVFIFGTRFVLPSYKLTNWNRIIVFLIVVLIMACFIFYRHTPINTAFKKMDIEHIYWVQSENSLQNGLLLGFIMNIETGIITAPHNYTEDEIKRIFQEYNLTEEASPSYLSNEISNNNPNVIIIMDEAFWDPTVLPNVSYSQDPIPFFRELRNKNVVGTMISPVFGGSTANVEFEILTGLSTAFLPIGSIAYQQYVEESIPSLPRIFKDNNYLTTAIHPYHSWFYEREVVYSLLGFDSFIHLDDFAQAEIRGEYIGDLEVSQKIIEQMDSTDQSQLIFAVTMQNHGPYPNDRYDNTSIDVTGDIDSEGLSMLEVYAEGLRDADKSLELLIDHLTKSDKPTVVVFLGDHLPYLGKEYLVYQETGFIQGSENGWSTEETIRMKSVPFVIWTNYDSDFSKLSDEISPISASYLGSYLIDITDQDSNHLFRFTKHVSRHLPVYDKTVSIDNSKNIYGQLPMHLQKTKNDYRLLQYDILFGEKYYLKYIQ